MEGSGGPGYKASHVRDAISRGMASMVFMVPLTKNIDAIFGLWCGIVWELSQPITYWVGWV